MTRILIVLCGLLAFQGNVFAETWEDRAASKTPWSADFPDDPACWNRAVEWNTVNPWLVGIGSHFLYEDFADCFRVCAKNDTCYRVGWEDEDTASAMCTKSVTDSLRNNLKTDMGVPLGLGEHSKSGCKLGSPKSAD